MFKRLVRTVSPILLLVAVIASTWAARPQPVAGQLPQVVLNKAEISTDQHQYQVGATVTICYQTPGPGQVTILDTLANGTTQTLVNTTTDGSRACTTGTVTPPEGTECLTLQYSGNFGSGTRQTCFQVYGGVVPPPYGRPSIWTDRSNYLVGDPIRICWSVPGPGQVTVTDIQAGLSKVLVSEFDDGSGSCISGVITPPLGQECARLDWSGANGQSDSTDTCWMDHPRLLAGGGSSLGPFFPAPGNQP